MASWVIVVMGTCCPDAVGHVGWFASVCWSNAGCHAVWWDRGSSHGDSDCIVVVASAYDLLVTVTDDESNPRPKDRRRGFECFRGELKDLLRGSAETNCSESPSGPVCFEEHSKVQLVVNVFGKRFTLHAPLHATEGHVKKAIEAAAGLEAGAVGLWSMERLQDDKSAMLWDECVRTGAEVELCAEVRGGMPGAEADGVNSHHPSSGRRTSDLEPSMAISSLGVKWTSLLAFCEARKEQLADMTTKEVCGELMRETRAKQCAYADLHPEMFGPANVFVSHAWGYRFLDELVPALSKWVESEEGGAEGERCLWIDILVVNQHSSGVLSDEANFRAFASGFEGVLQGIGRAVIVLSPWERPAWMGRAWCLFEYHVMMARGVRHSFVLPPGDEERFVQHLEEEGCLFLDVVSRLDMAEATAFSEFDEANIKRMVIEELGGFAPLNTAVIGSLREFVLETGLKAKGRMGEDSEIDFNLARLCDDLGLYEKSLELYEEELERRIKTFGNSHVEVAMTYNNMAGVYQKLGQLDKALETYEKALEIYIPALGNSHTSVANTYNNMGVVYEKLGQYEKALEMYQKDLEITIAALGNSHADVATTYNNMGEVYRHLGQYEKAMKMYEKDLEITIPALGNSHVDVAGTYNNMALVYQTLGQLEKALETYEKALEIFIPALGNSHVSVARTQQNMALVHLDLGNKVEALKLYEVAHATFLASFGPDHRNTRKAASGMMRLVADIQKLARQQPGTVDVVRFA
eukprot:CAMPEP_0113728054 /NCGR_PEP_ID=MMETSP0038_2-20120614/41626_1 /TAXON_ID=2898 /ORGANISM="Cryptomonas paramecium" /LENGTH=749 /DNA_ID=CAMNT_0000659433 /DNA_START=120 /DNA_END=2366 /DNA_ORIENTATION=+ /assembly_acc=CAM_ASM_000170